MNNAICIAIIFFMEMAKYVWFLTSFIIVEEYQLIIKKPLK